VGEVSPGSVRKMLEIPGGKLYLKSFENRRKYVDFEVFKMGIRGLALTDNIKKEVSQWLKPMVCA
jgi:hypothetical protein